MGEWRDIESAPKDGTVVLITDTKYYPAPVLAAFFDKEQEIYPWRFLSAESFDGIGEMEDNNYGDDEERSPWYGPTHWMPLPEPPND